jgi:hypothetical protein
VQAPGPDQGFLGITRAPPSAPGRGRAQSPARQKPSPQATKHDSVNGYSVAGQRLVSQRLRSQRLSVVAVAVACVLLRRVRLATSRASCYVACVYLRSKQSSQQSGVGVVGGRLPPFPISEHAEAGSALVAHGSGLAQTYRDT